MINTLLRIALFEPRIPQNTGNIARTCSAFNISLDLIGPLGFSLDDKYLKRAGLDYWKYLDITYHDSFNKFYQSVEKFRIIGFSKKANTDLDDVIFHKNDVLLFGREDYGLPDIITKKCSIMTRIPMPGGADIDNNNGVRSLNLSVACGIAGYQAVIQSQMH